MVLAQGLGHADRQAPRDEKEIVALARRLTVIMHRIWVDGTEVRWTREPLASLEAGRKVGAYVLLTVIAEETDEKAVAKRDFFIETSDEPAMTEWARVASMDFSRATYKDLAVQTFMAIPYVAGSYQTVANYLDGLAENGLAGVRFIFPDYEHDLRRLVENVLPRMKHRHSVRKPVEA